MKKSTHGDTIKRSLCTEKIKDICDDIISSAVIAMLIQPS